MALLDYLVGGAQVASSLYNTAQQYKMNAENRASQESMHAQNLAMQREVNAQNQYNLENAYQIAAADLRKAGLSKSMIAGGASGSPQVAYAGSAYQGSAPQSDLGSVLSNAYLSLAQLKLQKENLKVAQTNAETDRMNAETAKMRAENDNTNAIADREEGARQYNESLAYQKIHDAQTIDLKQQEIENQVNQWNAEFYEGVRQFNYKLNQDDEQFKDRLAQEADQFMQSHGWNKYVDAFKLNLMDKDYNWDVESFLMKLAQDKDIAKDNNDTKMFLGLMSFFGSMCHLSMKF